MSDELLAEVGRRYNDDPLFHYRVQLVLKALDLEMRPSIRAAAFRAAGLALLIGDVPEERLVEPTVENAILTTSSVRMEDLRRERDSAMRRLQRGVLR